MTDNDTFTASMPSGSDPLASLGTTPALPAPSVDLRERIHRIAAMAHDAIDKLEERLGSTTQGVMATQSKGTEQVRQYGDKLRDRIDAQPLQSIAIAMGSGLVLGKLFGSSKPEVRVVRVQAPEPSRWNSTHSVERRTSGLMDAARAHLERLGEMGQTARERASDVAGMGMAQAQDMTSSLARTASDMPAQLRHAMDRLLSRSQDYGSTARTAIQEHPAAGLGVVLGLGALATTLWMRGRQDTAGTPRATFDDHGNRVAWPHDQPGLRHRTQDMITERPVTSAAVVLGLGVLVAAMMQRR